MTDLQQRLREAKVYPKKGKLTGIVDATTMKSIARYQKRYDLPKPASSTRGRARRWWAGSW